MSKEETSDSPAANGATASLSPRRRSSNLKRAAAGRKLRIGDDWNAIRIIALSQSNPLKAVAEFIENSIDAHARTIVITRGKEKGSHYLRIRDDGDGIRRREDGVPDFDYVATHICDSVKRQLKAEGIRGVQGEFGIGLLSFWTVGEELSITSSGLDGHVYQMTMRRGDPSYRIAVKRAIAIEKGTELCIHGILPGLKQLSGERIQWYLASELRDRIRSAGVEIRIIDRPARAQYVVEPRRFEGEPLNEIAEMVEGSDDLRAELYLVSHAPSNVVGLYRLGTRVLADIAELEEFCRPPWNTGYLQGIVDCAFLNLTPGTRSGIIYDGAVGRLRELLSPIDESLLGILGEYERAQEEEANRDVLRTIQKALREALLSLPPEEYNWFDVRHRTPAATKADGTVDTSARAGDATEGLESEEAPAGGGEGRSLGQQSFFEVAGPLFRVRIGPASSLLSVGTSRAFRALARDRSNRRVEREVEFTWEIVDGGGTLGDSRGEIITYSAPSEPGLIRMKVTAVQAEISCSAEALITVTDSLGETLPSREVVKQGIPNYTFQRAFGELWRSRFDTGSNLVVVNSGHRDFVYASRSKALKLRYISRLFAKELVLNNFPGVPADQLLERLIELMTRTEEHLR